MKSAKRLFASLSVALLIGQGVFADLLEDGWVAYNQGQYEEAYDLFSDAFRADPGNVNVNFAFGQAASKIGKYSHAIFAYDRILMADSGHQEARYAKAQALFALGQQSEARREYAVLLDSDLPPALRAQVEDAALQIDSESREVKIRGELSVGVVYDDNVNYGPVNGNLVGAANQRDDAWGIEVGVGIAAEYDIGRKDNWMLVGAASMLNTWYDSAPEQETTTTTLRAGVRKVEQRDLYEVSGRIEMVDLGHDGLVDIYGIDSAWLHAKTPGDYLITRATVEHRDYDDDGGRDSMYAMASETWKHFFDNRRNTASVGGELFIENARENFNSNSGFGLRVDGERELPLGIIGYVTGRYRLYNYQDAWGIDPEREDNRCDLIVGARRRIAKNCTLDLRHQYVRNDSNIGISDYKRHRTSLTATFKF